MTQSQMTTPEDMINHALRKIRVKLHTEVATDAEVQQGLASLNTLIDSFERNGMDTGFEGNLVLAEELPFPRQDRWAIMYLLAVDLAPEYSVEVTPEVAINAQAGQNQLEATYGITETLGVDDGLRNRIGLRWGHGRETING